jgi:PKD repeat protein
VADFTPSNFNAVLENGFVNINFENNSTGATQYLWTVVENGVPYTFETEQLSYNFTEVGAHTVTLLATNGNEGEGCTSTKQSFIYIDEEVTIGIGENTLEAKGIKLLNSSSGYAVEFLENFGENVNVNLYSVNGQWISGDLWAGVKGSTHNISRPASLGVYLLVLQTPEKVTALKLSF